MGKQRGNKIWEKTRIKNIWYGRQEEEKEEEKKLRKKNERERELKVKKGIEEKNVKVKQKKDERGREREVMLWCYKSESLDLPLERSSGFSTHSLPLFEKKSIHRLLHLQRFFYFSTLSFFLPSFGLVFLKNMSKNDRRACQRSFVPLGPWVSFIFFSKKEKQILK